MHSARPCAQRSFPLKFVFQSNEKEQSHLSSVVTGTYKGSIKLKQEQFYIYKIIILKQFFLMQLNLPCTMNFIC